MSIWRGIPASATCEQGCNKQLTTGIPAGVYRTGARSTIRPSKTHRFVIRYAFERGASLSLIIGEGPVSACFILMVRFNIDADIMRFHEFLDGISQLAASPVFNPVHAPVVRNHRGFIPLDHRANLLTLVRMHNKDDFIMAHARSFLMG